MKTTDMRQRVLFLSINLAGGGAERVLSSLLNHIDRSAFEPAVALFVKEISYPIPNDIQFFYLGKEHWYDYPKLVWRLARIYRSWRPDVVLSFLFYPNNIAILAKILSRNRARIILSEHGMPSFALSRSKAPVTQIFIKWLPRFLYKKADKVICVSQSLENEIQSIYRLPSEKTSVIYNPLNMDEILRLSAEDVQHPWFKEKIPVIINVGSLGPVKGHVFLLQAFKLVLAKHRCRLMILGGGLMENSLKQLAAQLGIQDDVAFLGFQDNPFKYLSRSTMFVLSSLSEVFPMVLLEAMCCGLPVISTAYTGADEIITSGTNGLLVPPADKEALASAIGALIENRDYAVKLAEAARGNLGKFEANKITRIYETTLEGIRYE
jgi:glycosyltransferase involved in cell wall biosynthesis